MTDKNLMVIDGIPDPMTPLTMEIIHPENIAFEIEIRRARILSRTNVMSLKLKLWLAKLNGFDSERYQQAEREAKAAKSDIKELFDLYLLLINDLYLHYLNLTFTSHYMKLISLEIIWRCLMIPLPLMKHKIMAYRRAKHTMRQESKHSRDYLQIERKLEAYYIAKKQDAIEREAYRNLGKEAKIYKSFILQEWARRDDCHHKKTLPNGNIKKITPKIDTIDITATRIYLRILTSYKGFFGFSSALPGAVSISALVSDDALLNIQTAIRRPTIKIVNTGAWIAIDRLGSVGGIPNYVDFERMIDFYPEFIREDIPLCLGVTTNAQVVYLKLADYPHFLIAGYTGAGKSNIVNVLITTLIMKHSPDEIGLILIDMKGGLEFSHYEGLPHLIHPIVESIGDATEALARLETEMHRRFELLRSRRAKLLSVYNARVSENQKLPRLCLFFDEMATLAGQGEMTKRIIASLRELTAKGRAVGIHIFCCTQHPSVGVIPGEIKTNLTVRLTGRMPTASSSVTILGSGEAAKIEDIRGRMLLSISPEPQPIQTPFISDDRIAKSIVSAAKWQTSRYGLPELTRSDVFWTPEKVIALSLTHLNGNISYTRIYKAIDDISKSQARELCEQIWAMEYVEHEGVKYVVKIDQYRRRTLTPSESRILEFG